MDIEILMLKAFEKSLVTGTTTRGAERIRAMAEQLKDTAAALERTGEYMLKNAVAELVAEQLPW